MPFQGKDAVKFLEQLVIGDIGSIANGSGALSMFTNEKGGIIDDTVVTKATTTLYLYLAIPIWQLLLQDRHIASWLEGSGPPSGN